MVPWHHIRAVVHHSGLDLGCWCLPATAHVQLQRRFSLLQPHKQDCLFPLLATTLHHASPPCHNYHIRRRPATPVSRSLLGPWALHTTMRLSFGIVRLAGTMRACFQPPKHRSMAIGALSPWLPSPRHSGGAQYWLRVRARPPLPESYLLDPPLQHSHGATATTDFDGHATVGRILERRKGIRMEWQLELGRDRLWWVALGCSGKHSPHTSSCVTASRDLHNTG
jgi:hypothetical protein